MAFAGRILVALALGLVAVTVVGAAPGAGATGKSVPTVRLTRLAPLQVSGSGFGSRSSVRITVGWNAHTVSRTVIANRTGSVHASFATSLTAYACRATRIEALGRNGLKATWRPFSNSCLAIAVPTG